MQQRRQQLGRRRQQQRVRRPRACPAPAPTLLLPPPRPDCAQPGASPADGQPVRVYEMKPEEHKKVRKQIRKLTADHAAPLEMAAEGEEDE